MSRPETAGTAVPGIAVRPMGDSDVPAVVELLDRALGPAPGGVDRRSLFEWKHLANPFGRSVALVAESGDGLVGVRTLMRWELAGPGGAPVPAVRAVDTATAPEVRRRGVFSAMTRAALERCAEEGVALVFNTPNASSRPGYLKMGWRDVARWPVWLKVRRPARLLAAAVRRDVRSGAAAPVPNGRPPGPLELVPAAAALEASGLAGLISASAPGEGLHTVRSPEFLRWRYAAGPVPYHAVVVGDPVAVLVVARIRRRGPLTEAVVCEALCGPGPDSRARLGEALRALPGLAGADHAVAGHGPAWRDARAAFGRAGYRRVPRLGIRFVVRPVGGASGGSDGPPPPPARPEPITPDPLLAASWSLTLGDLELF